MLAGLQKEENSKISNIHFICCSNEVPAIDMIPEVAKQLLVLEQGFEAYDAYLGTTVFVFAPVLCILADNPRHAELINHLGSGANKYCRMCMVIYQTLVVICTIDYRLTKGTPLV